MIRFYRGKNAHFYRIIMGILVILLLAEISYISFIKAEQHLELYNRLYETGKLNTAAVNLKMQSYLDNLKAAASGIGKKIKEHESEAILKQLQIEISNNHFMKLNLIYPNGNGIGMDYETGCSEWSDFSQEEYFIRAIKGEDVIMAPFIDSQTKKEVVLFSIPIYSQKKVTGVLCGMVESGQFNKLIANAVYGGAGYSCIITSGGGVIFQSGKTAGSTTIEALSGADKQQDVMTEIRRDMQSSRSGNLHFLQADGEKAGAVYMPAQVNGWYVVTSVPYSVLNSSGMKVITGSVIFMAAVMIIFLLLLFAALWDRKKEKAADLFKESAITGEGDVMAIEVRPEAVMTGQNLEKALAREEFLVFLQPKYSILGEKAVLKGAEALVRWKSGESGFIYPNEFIPLFEHSGFITKLDMYMLEQVCRLQRKWLDEGYECVTISVNQSRLHLKNPEYIHTVKAIVDKYNIPYHLIELEITENAIFDDQKALIKTFRDLHDIGFITAMDDFGSGYSSLNMLKDIELDVIKIDKEFFGETLQNNRGRNVVACILKMLRELKFIVVAEGIESAEQVEFLKLCGCDMIQGYFFGKPSPVEEFESEHFYINNNKFGKL